MLVGRGSTKRSGSNSRQQQITQRKGGGVSATNSAALFIHLLYLGNVTDSTRSISGFNVLFKCIQQKVEASRIY